MDLSTALFKHFLMFVSNVVTLRPNFSHFKCNTNNKVKILFASFKKTVRTIFDNYNIKEASRYLPYYNLGLNYTNR